jgi:hypothetical protein
VKILYQTQGETLVTRWAAQIFAEFSQLRERALLRKPEKIWNPAFRRRIVNNPGVSRKKIYFLGLYPFFGVQLETPGC